ncbi:MAG: metallophosphoesterase [Anaerolineales bacterium]|jgi:predicted phosphodiesterase
MMGAILIRKNGFAFTALVSVLLASCALVRDLQSTDLDPAETLPIATHTEAVESETPEEAPLQTMTPTVTVQLEPFTFSLDGPARDIAYEIPLTLQFVDESSASFFFKLDQPQEGALFVWDGRGLVGQMEFDAQVTRHQFDLFGLEPGVGYSAIVGLRDESGLYFPPAFADGGWAAIDFETLESAWEPIRMGVIGDSGFGEQLTYDLLTEMAAFDLDFVVHTGDVVYRVYEDPDPATAFGRKYFLPFAPILHQMPVYAVPGNHEFEIATLLDDLPFYFHVFPPILDEARGLRGSDGLREYFRFSIGDYQFILLNSQAFYGSGERDAQTAWLEEQLQDQSVKHSIIVSHIPPFTSGKYEKDGGPLRSRWVPLFEASNVRLVLSGHDHNYQRLEVNGITYVVSGGGSTSLYPLSLAHPDAKAFERRSHFVLLELYRDRIELISIARGGEVLDQATIPLPAE